jgi:hypothetical protein
MKVLRPLCLFGVALCTVVIVYNIATLLPDRAPTYEQQRAATLAYQNQLQQSERDQARADALAPVYTLASAGVVVLVFVAISGVMLVLLDMYLQRRDLVYPNAAGHWPIRRADVRLNPAYAAWALEAAHTTQRIEAAARVVHASTVVRDVTPVAPALTTSAPTLADTVALADYIPRITPGHIGLGVLPGGDLIQLPFATCYHALLSGDTRSGKTNALDGVIVQLHHIARHTPLRLYAADYKQELRSTWQRSLLFSTGILTEPSDIADLLDDLVNGDDGIRARYDRFTHYGEETGRIIRNVGDYATARGESPTLSVVILDELNALLSAAKKDAALAGLLKQLLQIGAGAGIYVLGGAQYLTAATFGRDGSKQFVTRATFGAYDATSTSMVFGRTVDDDVRSYLTGAPGRGLIRTIRQPSPVAFQAFRCDERDIIEAIARHTVTSHRDERYSALESLEGETVTGVTPLHGDAEIAPVTASDGAIDGVTPEQRHAILTLASEGMSRRRIGQQIYGYVGGVGAANVKRVLEAVER